MKKYHHNEISNFVQKAGEIMNSFILYIDGKMIFIFIRRRHKYGYKTGKAI